MALNSIIFQASHSLPTSLIFSQTSNVAPGRTARWSITVVKFVTLINKYTNVDAVFCDLMCVSVVIFGLSRSANKQIQWVLGDADFNTKSKVARLILNRFS